MDRLILESYAKVNLFLEVVSKRSDNYHNIRTIFERIDLADTIVIQPRVDSQIKIISRAPGLPSQSSENLAYRSAKLLQESFHLRKGINIQLIKRIPVAAGLGGGSSNAAFVLLGLNKLWGLRLGREKLVSLARDLGSDVPFFIYDCPFAEGGSRGERVEPIKGARGLKLWHILAVPKIRVFTKEIYHKWDEFSDLTFTSLTKPKPDVNILNLALRRKDFPLISKNLFNSLEEVTLRLYPQLRQIKEKFIQQGLKTVLMSGSGPAVFGVLPTRKEAVSLFRQLKRELKNEDANTQVFLARTH